MHGGEHLHWREVENSARKEKKEKVKEFRIDIHTWSSITLDESHVFLFLNAYSVALLALKEANSAESECPPHEIAARLKHVCETLFLHEAAHKPHADAILLDSRHILRLRLLAARLRLLIESGKDWLEALQVAKDLLPLYECVLSSAIWPPLALHVATLAKLENLVGDPKAAAQHAQQAVGMLEVCLGTGSQAVREMDRILKETQYSGLLA